MRAPTYAALAAIALLLAGCPGTRDCKPGTLLVAVTLGDAAATADSLEVDVSIDGAAPKHTSVPHAGGDRMGTIEVGFPSGYPQGRQVTVTVTAAHGGSALASATTPPQKLAEDCGNASLTLVQSAPADMSALPDMSALVDMSLPGDMTCVFQSAEDCFNGIDDDCNGMTDCADPACTPATDCVPAAGGSAGFALGTTVAPSAACPTLYDTTMPTDLHNGLSGGANCTGCSCNATVSCSGTLYVYSSATACNADTTLTGGMSVGMVTNANMGTMCVVHSFAQGQTYRVGPYQTTSSACTSAGTATKTTPSWSMNNRFCKTDKVGAGCSPGYVCVPKVTTSHCALADGAQTCQPGYTPMGTWYTGFSDTRSCGACACGAQTPGDCTRDVNNNTIPQYMQLYAGGCSSGVNANSPSNSHNCGGLTFADGAFGWENFNPKLPSCPASAPLTGALTPTGQQTLCCK